MIKQDCLLSLRCCCSTTSLYRIFVLNVFILYIYVMIFQTYLQLTKTLLMPHTVIVSAVACWHVSITHIL